MEQAFAKIKHWWRAVQKRTLEDACDTSATSPHANAADNWATVQDLPEDQ
jgi:hypothetical protein